MISNQGNAEEQHDTPSKKLCVRMLKTDGKKKDKRTDIFLSLFSFDVKIFSVHSKQNSNLITIYPMRI